MKRLTSLLAVLLGSAGLWLVPGTVSALILSSRGNAPVRDAGWPEGALAVANLESRLGWFEGPPFGGGEWHFFYKGDTAAFKEALEAFAAIRAPALDLVIQDGPGSEDSILHLPQVDWTFRVWVPAQWNRLYNDPTFPMLAIREGRFHKPVEPPCMTVFAGPGGVDWRQVAFPPQVHVRDARASASGVDLSGGSVFQFGEASTIHDVPGDLGLRLSHPCGIRGKVVDDLGVPLTNFRGHLMVRIGARDSKPGSAGGTAPVKADGTFEFNAFSPGEYRLTLECYPADGRRGTQDQIVTVAPGVRATVTFVLNPH
jgi:hypothetical protein